MWKAVVFVAAVCAGGWYVNYYPAYKLNKEMKQAVETANANLPKVVNNVIRMEKMRYEKRVVYVPMTVLESVPVTDDDKPMLQVQMKEMYCNGKLKDFARAKVAMQFTLSFEAVHYRGVQWEFREEPGLCV